MAFYIDFDVVAWIALVVSIINIIWTIYYKNRVEKRSLISEHNNSLTKLYNCKTSLGTLNFQLLIL